jgi:hypothetical protein
MPSICATLPYICTLWAAMYMGTLPFGRLEEIGDVFPVLFSSGPSF